MPAQTTKPTQEASASVARSLLWPVAVLLCMALLLRATIVSWKCRSSPTCGTPRSALHNSSTRSTRLGNTGSPRSAALAVSVPSPGTPVANTALPANGGGSWEKTTLKGGRTYWKRAKQGGGYEIQVEAPADPLRQANGGTDCRVNAHACKIPRLVHICSDRVQDDSSGRYKLLQQHKKQNQGYAFTVYNKTSRRQFLKEHASPRVVKAHDTLNHEVRAYCAEHCRL